MRSHSQRMRIAEKLIEISNDLKGSYISDHGPTDDWGLSTQDIYLLNCDTEILNFLQREEIEVHSDVFKIGVSFGILVIQQQIKRRYYNMYGDMLEYHHKEQMFEEMQECIFDYTVNGAFDAY